MPTTLKLSGRMVNAYEESEEEQNDEPQHTIAIDGGYIRFYYDEIEVERCDDRVLHYGPSRQMIAHTMSRWIGGAMKDRTELIGEVESAAKRHPDLQ